MQETKQTRMEAVLSGQESRDGGEERNSFLRTVGQRTQSDSGLTDRAISKGEIRQKSCHCIIHMAQDAGSLTRHGWSLGGDLEFAVF